MKDICEHKIGPIKAILHTHTMTVKEYASKAKISPQAVTASLRKGAYRPGIMKYKRFGHQWSLEVIPALIRKQGK
jgi:hypothetical protein